jgi:hypothetical protein
MFVVFIIVVLRIVVELFFLKKLQTNCIYSFLLNQGKNVPRKAPGRISLLSFPFKRSKHVSYKYKIHLSLSLKKWFIEIWFPKI